MKKNSRISTAVILILLVSIRVTGFSQNPHILVNDGDKSAVLSKIKDQIWAKSILEEISQTVTPYVERHTSDPQWILSRYLMNRIPGKHYTRVFADESGSRLTSWTGNAPLSDSQGIHLLACTFDGKRNSLPETQHR